MGLNDPAAQGTEDNLSPQPNKLDVVGKGL